MGRVIHLRAVAQAAVQLVCVHAPKDVDTTALAVHGAENLAIIYRPDRAQTARQKTHDTTKAMVTTWKIERYIPLYLRLPWQWVKSCCGNQCPSQHRESSRSPRMTCGLQAAIALAPS